MMGLVNLREQEEKPKAIIMAGGAGVGKTFVTDKFKKSAEDKGWIVLNPDQYARNPDPEQRLSLAAAGSKINKQIDGLTKSEDKPNIIWDTTATNPSKIEALKNAGYDVLMIMVYAHPSVSFEQNFSRAGKDGEESLPLYVVLKTWIDSYNNDHVKNYKNMFGDKFILVNNTNKPGTDQSKINAFNKAAQQGGKALEKHIESIISKDPKYYTSSQMVAKPSNLTPEQLEDFNSKVKELNLRFLEEDDEEILKREYQKYFEKYNELMPAIKVGRRNGMKEVYASKMKNKLKNIQEKNKVYNDISSTLKDIGDTTDLDKATNIALQYIGANGLSEFLINNILNEEEEKNEKSVALFGGGFKPPTKGHLQVVQNGLLKHLEDIDRVKIIIGGGIRDGITPNQSEKIWNIYKRFIPVKTDIIKADMFSYYKDYLRKHKDDKVYIFVGSREGNEKDAQDVQYRQEYAKRYSDNVVVEEISTVGDTSGTKAREYFLSGNKNDLRSMLPEKLTDEEFDYILDILSNKSTNNIEKSMPKSTEPLSPINEDIIDKTDFVLPRGEQMILQAEDEDYNRGLIVELTEEGGYKMYYWYGDDAKIYPVEVEVDGKSIKPDAREVYMKFHPELEKGEIYEGRKKKKDPKKGTGKKPKGSGRRLYTDENPKDTVSIKFSTRQDIIDTLNKKSFKSKSHKRQSQIINLIHQRVRAALGRTKDPAKKKKLKSGFEYIIKRKEASKKKTERLKKQKSKNENIDPKSQAKHKGKSAPFGSAYEPLNENATYSSKIDYKQQIKDLTKHMIKKGMNILPLPKVIFKHSDVENASQFLGKTAYYMPDTQEVVLYTEGRHPKDIARSFAHEMIHHIQNLEGRLDNINTTNTNQDDHLNDIEREAYTKGNMVFRNWTDNMDGEEVSSLNEIGDASSKIFNYKKKEGPKADFYRRVVDANEEDVDFNVIYEFKTDLDTLYKVELECEYDPKYDDLEVEINFYAGSDQRMTSTNKGEQYSVMATITDIIVNFINEWDKYFYISYVYIEPKVEDDEDIEMSVFSKRGRLYKMYLDKQLSRLNKSYKVEQKPNAFKMVPTFENPSIPRKVNEKNKDPFGLNQFARELIQDDPQPVKEDIKSLAPQEEDVIFNKNCGCDKT